jgi:hypothetical protein
MAKGVPNRGTKPGIVGGKAPVVGYGQKGHVFHNQKNYNQSMEGNRHAKNPALSTKPVGYGKQGNAFFSKAAEAHAKTPTIGLGHPHAPLNPPSAVGNGGGAPRKGAGSGTVPRAPRAGGLK